MATPGFDGIVRYRTALAYFLYTDGGSEFPYGGKVTWHLNYQIAGTSTIQPYAEHCDGFTFTGLEPGTIYSILVIVWKYTATGGSSSIGMYETTLTTLSRPSAFAWTVPKISGGSYYIGASEWIGLTYNIVNVLEYAGYAYNFSYSLPVVGEVVTAARYNDIRAAIQTVPGYGYYIPQVSSGDTITAYQMNILVSELNAIP